jgi:hypothetical protein
MAANADELDASLGDQPPGETLASAQQLGDLAHA